MTKNDIINALYHQQNILEHARVRLLSGDYTVEQAMDIVEPEQIRALSAFRKGIGATCADCGGREAVNMY